MWLWRRFKELSLTLALYEIIRVGRVAQHTLGVANCLIHGRRKGGDWLHGCHRLVQSTRVWGTRRGRRRRRLASRHFVRYRFNHRSGHIGRDDLQFVSNAHVFTQTVLVLELLAAIVALALRLRCVLRANMSPQIDRCDNYFTELTLRPLVQLATLAGCSIWNREIERE